MDAIIEFLKQYGTPAGAGAIASLVLEWVPQFQALPADVKQRVVVVATVVVAVGSYLALTYVPASVWQQAAPFFGIVVSVVAAYGGSQIWHKTVNK